jgi:hypothetical protein
VPAYIRKKVQLNSRPSESTHEVSKYTLSSDQETNTVRIRDNNPYLHDVVD